MPLRYMLDLECMPDDDATAEALHVWFGSKSFTKRELVDHIADLSEDRSYAKWEFDQLLEMGYIKDTA